MSRQMPQMDMVPKQTIMSKKLPSGHGDHPRQRHLLDSKTSPAYWYGILFFLSLMIITLEVAFLFINI